VKKIENGQLQYHIEVFDFADLVNEIVEETKQVLKTQTIKTEIENKGMIKGDRNKIGQVMTNLIDNARKYSPADSVIEIKTFNKNHSVAVEVKDSGIGIPKEQQHKIFERFFRVEGEKENTYAGLGLGLYICAEIVKWHNGTIGVNSEKGKGSIFHFELPIYE
jgi:signal transduction histidine kinase